MSKLNFGIIGAGVWGGTHASIFKEHPDVNVRAVADLNLDKANNLADNFNVPSVYSDYKKMLKEVKLDAVSIVTPDFAHAEPAVDCARAGKNVLLEKPLATNREDVKKIVEAVKKNDVRIMVDLHNRWNPPFEAAKKDIENNGIGSLVSAYYRLNDIKWVATDMLSWTEETSILWFLGSHTVDTLRWLFDDEVKKVYSVSTSGVLKKIGIDTKDMYQTILEFKNGGIATIENSWITPNSHPCINDIKCTLTGSEGIINIDVSNNRLIEKYSEDKHINPDVLVRHFVHGKAKGFAYESIRSFADCLVTGEDFLVSLEDAANTSYVILAILESARKNKPIEVRY